MNQLAFAFLLIISFQYLFTACVFISLFLFHRICSTYVMCATCPMLIAQWDRRQTYSTTMSQQAAMKPIQLGTSLSCSCFSFFVTVFKYEHLTFFFRTWYFITKTQLGLPFPFKFFSFFSFSILCSPFFQYWQNIFLVLVSRVTFHSIRFCWFFSSLFFLGALLSCTFNSCSKMNG